MAQSLSKVYIHVVFSTKHGESFIKESIRKSLHSYIIGTLSNAGSYTEEIFVNPDHFHALITLPRTKTLAQMVSRIKTTSSKWIKQQGIKKFSWQNGYSVFSVSASKIPVVKNYILNQPNHHRKVSFKDELRQFFKHYQVEYDERYVWD